MLIVPQQLVHTKVELYNLKAKLVCYPIGDTGFLKLLADRKIEYKYKSTRPETYGMPVGKESWNKVANKLGVYVYFHYVKGADLPFNIGMGTKNRAFVWSGYPYDTPHRSTAWFNYVEAHGGTKNIETAIVNQFPYGRYSRQHYSYRELAFNLECEWKSLFNDVIPESMRTYLMEDDKWVLHQKSGSALV